MEKIRFTEKYLPPLVEFGVHRETYLSQKTTYEIFSRLWIEAPYLVADLAEQEDIVAPYHRDEIYFKASYGIEEWFWNNAADHLDPEILHLSFVDFFYELSRCLRLTMGLSDIPVLGIPLAKNQDDHMVELIERPITEHPLNKEVTQESVNKICSLVYQKDPKLMFAIAESNRHLVNSYSIHNDLLSLIKEIGKFKRSMDAYPYKGELTGRINEMCYAWRMDLLLQDKPALGRMQ